MRQQREQRRPVRPAGQGGSPGGAVAQDYPVPPASAAAWRQHQRQPGPHNPGLIFERFAPVVRDGARGAPPPKRLGLEAVAKAAGQVDAALLAAWNARWGAAARAAGAQPFILATEWRLVTGLGRQSAFEVGFTFHRYGFPVLPASGLKGLARTAGLLAIAAELASADLAALADTLSLEDAARCRAQLAGQYGALAAAQALAEDWRAIFGTTAAAGQAIFLDGIPRQPPRLDLDIMNPHYPDYYGDPQHRTPPKDSQSPRPVYFLTVAAGTELCFAVGWRGPAHEPRRTQAETWLRAGLIELGAGAKTSAGYGYFITGPGTAPLAPAGPAQEVGHERPGAPAGTTTAAIAARPELPARPAEPAPPPVPPPPPTVTRYGVITDIDSAKTKRGHVEDDETHVVYRFNTAVIRGNFPPRRARVRFDLQGDEVVLISRL